MQTEQALGNLDSAKAIFEADRKGCVPDGWNRVGSGAYRNAYRSPDGFVYKVCKHRFNSSEDNVEEINAYQKILAKKLTKSGWRVAPVVSYDFVHGSSNVTVNVMEFVEGQHEKMTLDNQYEKWEEIENAFFAFGLIDGHCGNYIVTGNGEKVIIDLAS